MAEQHIPAPAPAVSASRAPDQAAAQRLRALHHQFLDALDALDSLGEYVIAAHLTSAIDELESRLDAARLGRELADDSGQG